MGDTGGMAPRAVVELTFDASSLDFRHFWSPGQTSAIRGAPDVTATRRDDSSRNLLALVWGTAPTKGATARYLDLVAAGRNGGSRG